MRSAARSLGLVFALTLAVLCAGLGGTASAAVSGLQLVSADIATNSTDKGVTAYCPDGKQVLGTGGEITGGLGEVIVDEIVPLADLSGVRVEGYEDAVYNSNWHVTAHAICADPVPGLRRVTGSSGISSTDKGADAFCPPPLFTTGAGAELTGALGEVTLQDITPNLAFAHAMAREEDNYTDVWWVKSYAICVSPLELGEVLNAYSATSAYNSADLKSATVSCPAGRHVVGAGGVAGNGSGEMVMDDITPNQTLTSVTAVGYETDPYSDNWLVEAHAICAGPSL
jgi:hypothetical protein